MNGNALANGAGYNQNLKILYGDFNDDGVVNAQDGVGGQWRVKQPPTMFSHGYEWRSES